MGRTALIAAGWLYLCVTAAPAAAASLALVLLNDVSNSVDDVEYALMKDGYRAAFSDPDVIAAIAGHPDGVAVAYVEFSGGNDIMLVQDFDLITDAGTSQRFGEAVALAPRTSSGNTDLSAGLRAAAELLKSSPYSSARMVIDIASDHPGDGGRSAGTRKAIVAEGITINALPMVDDRPIGTFDGRQSYTTPRWGSGSIADFYEREVIGGQDSFVVEARDINAFGDALKRKLLLELVASNDGLEPLQPDLSAETRIALR